MSAVLAAHGELATPLKGFPPVLVEEVLAVEVVGFWDEVADLDVDANGAVVLSVLAPMVVGVDVAVREPAPIPPPPRESAGDVPPAPPESFDWPLPHAPRSESAATPNAPTR